MGHRAYRGVRARLLSVTAVCVYSVVLGAAFVVTARFDVDSIPVVACIVTLFLAYSIWCWRGRSALARDWAGQGNLSNRLVLGVFPGLGLLFLPLVVLRIPDAPEWLKASGALVFLMGAAVFVIGFLVGPRWWGPAWFRNRMRFRQGRNVDGQAD